MSLASPDLAEIQVGSPIAESLELAIARAIAIPYASSGRVYSEYKIDMEDDIIAELRMKMQDDNVHVKGYIPDRVCLNIGVNMKTTRDVEAKVETEKDSNGENDIFALSVRVREITDTRRIHLKNGVRVRRAITIGQDYYRAPKESQDFNPHILRDVITILKPLKNPPKHNGEPIEIYFPWDGFEDDAVSSPPNGVLYEKNDKEWTKTYIYIDKKGRVERPIDDEVSVAKGEPELKVRFAPVSPDELQDIEVTMVAAGTLGSVDASLIDLIGKEVSYDKDYATKLSAEYDKRRKNTHNWDPDLDVDEIRFGHGEPDEPED